MVFHMTTEQRLINSAYTKFQSQATQHVSYCPHTVVTSHPGKGTLLGMLPLNSHFIPTL
jgi:hypothetical protein